VKIDEFVENNSKVQKKLKALKKKLRDIQDVPIDVPKTFRYSSEIKEL
jgi:hypothetical protein